MRTFTAKETADNFLKIIRDLGVPHLILTDQGTNFLSKVLKDVCEHLGIAQLKTSPYHPQSNGQLERMLS